MPHSEMTARLTRPRAGPTAPTLLGPLSGGLSTYPAEYESSALARGIGSHLHNGTTRRGTHGVRKNSATGEKSSTVEGGATIRGRRRAPRCTSLREAAVRYLLPTKGWPYHFARVRRCGVWNQESTHRSPASFGMNKSAQGFGGGAFKGMEATRGQGVPNTCKNQAKHQSAPDTYQMPAPSRG